MGIVNGLIDHENVEKKYTFSGIAILSPQLFTQSKVTESELWNDFLKPASIKGLVSGEIYMGALKNLNSLEEVEKLDASLSEE
jgi:NDP-sugar pyrophosphorylase family protein